MMPILMPSIIIQVGIFGHNSLQMIYLLNDMVNHLICNILVAIFTCCSFCWAETVGVLKFFPHDIQTGGWGGFLPTLFNIIHLSLVTTSQVITIS